MLKKIIALAIAAGFASASFAQAPSAGPAGVPVAAAEKKVEAVKAAEPMKAEVAKVEKGAVAKADKVKAHAKEHAKPAAMPSAAPTAAPAAK